MIAVMTGFMMTIACTTHLSLHFSEASQLMGHCPHIRTNLAFSPPYLLRLPSALTSAGPAPAEHRLHDDGHRGTRGCPAIGAHSWRLERRNGFVGQLGRRLRWRLEQLEQQLGQ